MVGGPTKIRISRKPLVLKAGRFYANHPLQKAIAASMALTESHRKAGFNDACLKGYKILFVFSTTLFIRSFVTLFVIIDPIGLTPVFVSLTNGETIAARRAIALRATVIGAVILLIFCLFGESALTFLGISLPAFRISGGILLFLTALDMLFTGRRKRRAAQSDAEPAENDPSVFPLAIPLIAGPGAITTMILLSSTHPGIAGTITLSLVMLAVIILVFLSFLTAPMIEKALGDTGTEVVTRLLGMLLAALAVQFILEGLSPVLSEIFQK